MTVGDVTPGYELWRPNRTKNANIATRALMALLLFISAALTAIITIGGFNLLQGGTVMGVVCLVFAGVYVLFGILVLNWSRGALTVVAAAAILMAIYALVAAPSWFQRTGSGFNEGLLPAEVLGILTALMIPLQIITVAVAVIGFNQEWHVEEERPIGSGREYGAGASEAPAAG